MPKKEKIPAAVARRLPKYQRLLAMMKKDGVESVSSQQLADMIGVTASQIRQDLNCFGVSGRQGCGYRVGKLQEALDGIFQIQQLTDAIIIGAADAVRTLTVLLDFASCGYRLIGEFSSDDSTSLQSEAEMYPFCDKNRPLTAIVCTPKAETRRVVQALAEHGVTAVCNYSSEELPENFCGMNVENVALSDALLKLRYRAAKKTDNV